jgi:glutamate carboxypeptidase
MALIQIMNYFQEQEAEFAALLLRFVRLKSPTGDKIKINHLGRFLAKLFAEFFPVQRRVVLPAGDCLLLDAKPSRGKRIVLLAHLDTVPGIETAVRQQKQKVYGPGAFDMKAGMVLFYFVCRALARFAPPALKRLRLILTPDEESGSRTARPILLKECRQAAAVILPEPCCGDGGVKSRRKGIAHLQAFISGQAAHSGIEPEKGRDANRGLIRLFQSIEQVLTDFPDVQFNAGILSGGVASNVVSPQSSLQGELRSFSNRSLQRAVGALRRLTLPGLHLELEAEVDHPALAFDRKNRRLFALARKVAARLGQNLVVGASGGASDGSDLSGHGIPVLDGVGLKGGQAHAPGEFVDLADFPFRAALLCGVIEELVHDADQKP